MKQINLIGVALLGIALGSSGCNSSDRQKNNQTADSAATGVTTAENSGKVSELKIGADDLIIPGYAIGKIKLGEDVQEVFKLLGKADDGDAAMGKAWGIWHRRNMPESNSNGDISVYSSYKDSTMMAKDVKQVVVSAANFSTREGLRYGKSLEEIQRVFPELKPAGIYTKGKDSLLIYDDENKGIAFDLKKEGKLLTVVAVTVHPKKTSVNSTYLTIHPGWKKVSEN